MAQDTADKPSDILELLRTRKTLGEKFSKKRIEDVTKWRKDYNITTIKDAKFENLNNQMQIPYIFSTVESNVANFFEKFPSIIMKQRGKEDREFTSFAESIWDYLNDKLGLEETTEDAGREFSLTGLCGTRYGWNMQTVEVEEPIVDPATGQPQVDELGQPVLQKVAVPVKNYPYVCNLSYKSLFFSPESKFILDDDENKIPYEYWVQTLSKDEAEAEYGIVPNEDELEVINIEEYEKTVETLQRSTLEEDKNVESDTKRVKLYNYVGTLPKEVMSGELKTSYHASYVYWIVFSSKRIYKEPVRLEKKPVLLLGNYGMMDEFWRFGEAKVLRELEQDVSLGRSRIMDLRDRQGTKVVIPTGTEFDEISFKKPRDYTFMRFVGAKPPEYMNPPPIPETIITGINMSRDDIQMASATMDISRASMTNTVSTATGQKIFAGETNKRNSLKKKKIARYLRALAKNLLILCGQNWDEQTFAKITDLPVEVIQQQGWKQKLIDLGNEYDVDIDTDSMSESKEQDAANAIALYREMSQSPYIDQDELIKFTLSTGFQIKDAERFMSGFVSPEDIMAVMKHMLEAGVIQPEDAQMMVDKLDAIEQQKQMEQQGQPTGGVGANEGRPPINSPTSIVQKSMPGTDTTQMSAQRQAAPKQTNVPKGPQMNRR